MSEKNLKSLRFHGLDDIYKIPSTAEDVGATPVSHLNNSDNPHNVTASQIGAAVPSDVTNAKTMAINESKTYTNSQVRKAAPRNLLDNSDFRNPVNQRGKTSYSGAVYGIDRWKGASTDCVVDVSDGYVKFSSSGDGVATQRINTDEINLYGKTATIACEDYSGNIYCAFGTIPESKPEVSQVSCYIEIDTAQVRLYISKSTGPTVQIYTPNCELRLKWVALYEGEYTLETLPEYQPKGYGAELLECMRYFYRFATDENGIYLPCIAGITQIPGFLFPVPMRTAPSMTIEVLKTWTTAGFTDISGSISSKRCTKGGLQYIELTSAQSKSGLITLTANFSADLPQPQ